ncbi:Phospholipase D/Transphosphatidylase family protein [alpha proteobacterium BAL199]|jgi:cardiolipin synthase C|nr:Phospholipase D/Transphosphatidylase family protein [alpha proteobacterium BAL199]
MDVNECTAQLDDLCRRHVPDDGRSGFSLIRTGQEAFLTLHGLAAASQRTLDVQYYLWEDDWSGRRLLMALLDAADRGVRVRLLLDDIGATRSDPELARLGAYPNVEVRLYNPFPRRFGLVFGLLFQARRVSRRMHNKAFIADRAVAVVGGRNVGDRYFELDSQRNFRDLDLFAAGPVVARVAESFDAFWNSSFSRPIHALDRGRWRLADVRSTVRRGLRRKIRPAEKAQPVRYPALDLGDLEQQIRCRFAELIVADQAMVLVDSPDKPETGEPRLLRDLLARLEGTPMRELLIEATYFIPTRFGTRLLSRLVRRGTQVRILTNSAGSGDVPLAYAAYRQYRMPLLRAGIQLYELRDKPFRTSVRNGSIVNLHTKAAVIDQRDVFIGSLNLDPRSATLNTEIGLLVRSPALAEQVTAFIEDGMAPSKAFQPMLRGRGLVWRTDDGDGTVELEREPGTTLWRTFLAWALYLLPLEAQL